MAVKVGRLGGMQVQAGWRVREEGRLPLLGWTAPSLLWSTLWWGTHWQSSILIWLCKCLLQKAMPCNPSSVVERRTGESTGMWSRNMGTQLVNDCLGLNAPMYHVQHIHTLWGRLWTQTLHTRTISVATESLTRPWIQYSNAYCFSRCSWVQH